MRLPGQFAVRIDLDKLKAAAEADVDTPATVDRRILGLLVAEIEHSRQRLAHYGEVFAGPGKSL